MKYAGRTASHVLTPSRKPLGKAVARSSWKSAALKILKDKNGLKYCLKKIGIMIRNELHSMCSSGNAPSFAASLYQIWSISLGTNCTKN